MVQGPKKFIPGKVLCKKGGGARNWYVQGSGGEYRHFEPGKETTRERSRQRDQTTASERGWGPMLRPFDKCGKSAQKVRGTVLGRLGGVGTDQAAGSIGSLRKRKRNGFDGKGKKRGIGEGMGWRVPTENTGEEREDHFWGVD